jgi:CheY-like chemotaxis protein
MRSPLEVPLSDHQEIKLSELGFLPLVHLQDRDFTGFLSAQSCAAPRLVTSSTKLNYNLCLSRFVHYLMLMARDRIGSFATVAECERWLNQWIGNYVLTNHREQEVLDEQILREVIGGQNPQVLSALLSRFSALRRVRILCPSLPEPSVLWVDDVPENNSRECRVLRAFGVLVDQVRSTDEAITRLKARHYDLILSDMVRDGVADAGIRFLAQLRAERNTTPVVFYVRHVDESRGVPPGALGITVAPEVLFDLVLDALEIQPVGPEEENLPARRPLAEAKVELRERDGRYEIIALLRPHFQFESPAESIRVVATVPLFRR